MTDRTASAGRAVERAKSARRGGPSGRQAVGDYVGQPAGDAAQAVRRAGLRPGLDRSFGCAEELIGLVVAQEPTAGSSLARNGMVTLYVAAPGSEPIDEETDAAGVESGGPEPAVLAPVEAEQAEAASAPARVRRRKPGRARRAAPAFDAPPPPALPDRDSASEPPTVVLAAAGRRAAVGVAAGAGRAGWRTARRRSARGARRGGALARRVRGACGGCARRAQRPGEVARGISAPARGPRAGRWPRCSCMVARASRWREAQSAPRSSCGRSSASPLRWTASTRTPRPRARSRAASGPPRGIGRRRRSERLRPARGRRARGRDTPARTAPRPALRTRRRRPAPAPVRETVAPPVAPVGEAPVPQSPPPSAPAPAPAAPRASAPPAAAPEQTGGGLFSP